MLLKQKILLAAPSMFISSKNSLNILYIYCIFGSNNFLLSFQIPTYLLLHHWGRRSFVISSLSDMKHLIWTVTTAQENKQCISYSKCLLPSLGDSGNHFEHMVGVYHQITQENLCCLSPFSPLDLHTGSLSKKPELVNSGSSAEFSEDYWFQYQYPGHIILSMERSN